MISRTYDYAAKPLGFAMRVEFFCFFGLPFRREANERTAKSVTAPDFKAASRQAQSSLLG
jgi:hypothetical protein